jgi:energy-coupling factor transporter ATP-binding protein EcfA2
MKNVLIIAKKIGGKKTAAKVRMEAILEELNLNDLRERFIYEVHGA